MQSFTNDPIYHWLYSSNNDLLFLHFVYCFKQAQIWKERDGIDCVYCLHTLEGEIAGLFFLIPPGCVWDEQLFESFNHYHSGMLLEKLKAYDLFYDGMLDGLITTDYYLLYLAVNPTHQNRGYGSKLLRDCLARVIDASIVLDISDVSLLKYYEKFGFKLYQKQSFNNIETMILRRIPHV